MINSLKKNNVPFWKTSYRSTDRIKDKNDSIIRCCYDKNSLNNRNAIKKKAIFEGIRAWYRTIKESDSTDTLYILERSEPSIRASELFNMCNKKGNTVLLTFKGSLHSSLIVFDSKARKAIYLSFGGYGFENESGSIDDLIGDMEQFEDLIDSQNIVILENMNCEAILAEWDKVAKSVFNSITNNCSEAAKKLLLCGAKDFLHKKKKLKNNCFMQMPFNTHKLALEIKILLENNKKMKKQSSINKHKNHVMKNSRTHISTIDAYSITYQKRNTTFCFETSV